MQLTYHNEHISELRSSTIDYLQMIEGIMTRCHRRTGFRRTGFRRTGFRRHQAATVLGRHVGELSEQDMGELAGSGCDFGHSARAGLRRSGMLSVVDPEGEEGVPLRQEIIKKAFGILSQIYLPNWVSCPPSFMPHLYE
jgi:hypothetical protein